MYAMYYEILIRQSYQCARYGVPGANADIYRQFETAYHFLEQCTSGKDNISVKDALSLVYIAGLEAGTVITYLRDAINNVKKKYKNELTQAQHDCLDDCVTELLGLKSNVINKNMIENVIDKTQEVFKDLNLLAQ